MTRAITFPGPYVFKRYYNVMKCGMSWGSTLLSKGADNADGGAAKEDAPILTSQELRKKKLKAN